MENNLGLAGSRNTGKPENLPLENALRFMLAGNSSFRITSGETGTSFYYRVIRNDDILSCVDPGACYVYKVLGGRSYKTLRYLGILNFNFFSSRFEMVTDEASLCKPDDILITALVYTVNKLIDNRFKTNVIIEHNGYCGVCGNELSTRFETITGLNKSCLSRVDIPSKS